jgi:hypothetical protein
MMAESFGHPDEADEEKASLERLCPDYDVQGRQEPIRRSA